MTYMGLVLQVDERMQGDRSELSGTVTLNSFE